MDKTPPTTPEGEKRTSSPATSTPEQQEVHKTSGTEAIDGDSPAKFRQSELSESDESAINDSLWVNNSTTPFEKPDEDTTIQDADPNSSCVAFRTRAKSSLSDPETSVIFSLSYIMKEMKKEEGKGKDTTVEEDEQDILKTPQSIPMDWIGDSEERKKVWGTLTKIEQSVDIEEKEKKDKKEDDLEKYQNLSEVVLDKARKIIVPDMAISDEYQELGASPLL